MPDCSPCACSPLLAVFSHRLIFYANTLVFIIPGVASCPCLLFCPFFLPHIFRLAHLFCLHLSACLSLFSYLVFSVWFIFFACISPPAYLFFRTLFDRFISLSPSISPVFAFFLSVFSYLLTFYYNYQFGCCFIISDSSPCVFSPLLAVFSHRLIFYANTLVSITPELALLALPSLFPFFSFPVHFSMLISLALRCFLLTHLLLQLSGCFIAARLPP